MCAKNAEDARDKEEHLIMMEHLFEYEHQDANGEDKEGKFGMVMLFETMCKGIQANTCGHCDHDIFKDQVIDQVIAKEREAG